MSNGKEVATIEKPVLPAFSMTPRTFDEAMKFAELMSKSDLVPKDFKDKPGNILVAIQKGLEVGLSPMAALETIAVINGRASLWGDGMLGIVQASPSYEYIDESQSSEKAGVCTIKRKGEPPYTATFTLEDAKRAGLLGKAGPWTAYTKRMLQLRARGFALRDKFADVLKGMIAAEEALDIQADVVRENEPPPQSLKDKLKAQVTPPPTLPEAVAEGIAGFMAPPPIEQPAVPTSEPDRSLDADLLKQEFDGRFAAAKNVNELTATMNDVLDSDLPVEWKKGFEIRFKERLQAKKK